MENNLIVKSAEIGMAGDVAMLRSDCIHSSYKGFLPEELLKTIDISLLLPQTTDWLSRKGINILSRGDRPVGYVCFFMTSTPKLGAIRELGMLPDCDTHELYELVSGAVRALQSMGADQVETFVLRDNLRMRFQMELFGFKRDYQSMEETFNHIKMQKQRYVYRLS